MKTKVKLLLGFLAIAALAPIAARAQGGDKKQKDVEVKCPSGIDHSAWDRLLKKYVDAQGLVNYTAWKNNKEDRQALDTYLKQFAAKTEQDAEGNEKAASLTNAYNAIVISILLNAYPVESIHETKKPFETKTSKIGGAMVSLNDIENGTLRPMLKYRAHSVLVCGARSCPPLQRSAYSAGAFEEQDATAYRTWLAREDLNKFMPQENKAKVSEVFKWFKADFEKSLAVPKVFEKYGPESAQQLTGGGKEFDLSYLSYNWGLNDQGEHGRNYSKINLIFDKLSGN
ncbi:MAG: DUF547 domain-containing protein [Verrucomicrobiaceae bacterium]|nr:DUF547 domain-containing protein [Verrucomicrobiaceae bacterium]